MDLMTASTSFSKLKTKYQDFRAPTIRIHVDGVEIVGKLGARIPEISVELTSGFDASGCSFDVTGEYVPKNTAFSTKGAVKHLQLGAKVEVELGYIETVTVFHGLIVEIEYCFGTEGNYIHVECMDAKCLLMKQQRLELYIGKSVTDTVNDMLEAQPFSSYITGKQVDSAGERLNMIPAALENDYQFAVRYAGYLGYEFFIIQGKAYYRKTPASSSAVMTLLPRAGILSANLSLRSTGLVKKTRVVGVNPGDDKAVSGEAPVSGKFSSGNTAARMMGSSVKTHFDHGVTSNEQASERAKQLMKQSSADFGRIRLRCVGLPELVPGRSVKVDGLSAEADRQFYILDVRHTLDSQGFITELEGRADSL